MSNSELVTRRLHVSGLTPQISATELKARFSSFGNVKALDGLGKLDALGQPRPFAYVTLETTKPQLAKCLNLLSGTTWRGAKLRIGEAKPDFRERTRKENEVANDSSPRPIKRRRLARGTEGVHAPDMSLVTPTSLRPGWRITPLGRLVRPMRMRPLRPLHTPITSDAAKKKKKKKKKVALVRARRKKINPEDWGSSYLSGLMLESQDGMVLPEMNLKIKQTRREEPTMEDADQTVSQTDDALDVHRSRSLSPSSSAPSPPSCIPSSAGPNAHEHLMDLPQSDSELAQETTRSLALLNSLFSSGRIGTDEDWGGPESLSDLGMDTEPVAVTVEAPMELDDGIEYVPREGAAKVTRASTEDRKTRRPEEEIAHTAVVKASVKTMPEAQPQADVQRKKLKDIFALRPEDADFSILGNLDLDLELDEDLPSISAPPPLPHATRADVYISESSAVPPTFNESTFSFDPKRPFFFPHSLMAHSSLTIKSGDPRDIFSGKLDFFRTESEEDIRNKWKERKVELTREWKRRHREAVKSARRRGSGTHD